MESLVETVGRLGLLGPEIPSYILADLVSSFDLVWPRALVVGVHAHFMRLGPNVI